MVLQVCDALAAAAISVYFLAALERVTDSTNHSCALESAKLCPIAFSPWQLLLLFLGAIETERPSDWLILQYGKLSGQQ